MGFGKKRVTRGKQQLSECADEFKVTPSSGTSEVFTLQTEGLNKGKYQTVDGKSTLGFTCDSDNQLVCPEKSLALPCPAPIANLSGSLASALSGGTNGLGEGTSMNLPAAVCATTDSIKTSFCDGAMNIQLSNT